MKICIVGTGYVGLVTGACFADLGNKVICVDNNREKIAFLNKGKIPIYEPGLEELVSRGRREGRLFFTTDIARGVRDSDVIFIAVGTPSKLNGAANLIYVENVARQIAKHLREYRLIVEKSTVPVQTGKWVEHTIRANVRKGVKFDVASNPEFLREGSAIYDFMNPDRIVLGVESKRARDILTELYKSLNASVVITNIKSAEIIKHASNSFLATKISFINAVANICDAVGADVVKVSEGMGLDRRIGKDFLDAGIGFGGSCFPKDLAAFLKISEEAGVRFNLLKEVEEINQEQKHLFCKRIEESLWNLSNKTVGVLGLSFKPNTDDMREAPSVDIVRWLQNEGATVRAYDPQVRGHAGGLLKKVKFGKDAYDTARGSDALLILTDWNEFKELDLKRIKKLLKKPLVIDGRNLYSPKKMKDLGFQYVCVGRAGTQKQRGGL